METQAHVKYHAAEARRWAEAADNEAVGSGGDAGLAGDTANGEFSWKRAGVFAGVSQAHGTAALATVLGEGYISGEMEMVKFAGQQEPVPIGAAAETLAKKFWQLRITDGENLEPWDELSDEEQKKKLTMAATMIQDTLLPLIKPSSTQPAVPVVPAPGVPARGVLTAGQRVLAVPTGGHVWPAVLKTGVGAPYEGVAGVVERIDPESDLIKVLVDPQAGGQVGPTVQLHREQLRIPAPPPPEPPGEPRMSG